MYFRKPLSVLAFALLAPVFGSLACQADLLAKEEKKAPPDGVSEAVKDVLGETCHQVLEDGKPILEVWLRTTLPLKEKPVSVEKGLDTFVTASLLGVVQVHQDLRDYRDDDLNKGVYTMRFGKILADGNHLGTTEYPHFVVLIPATKDPEVDGFKTYKKMTKASSRETISEHPMVMSLRPVKEKPPTTPSVLEPAPEHKSVVVVAQGKPEGADQASELVFELVFEGIGEI